MLLCCLGLGAVGFMACAWLVLCLCCLVQQLSSWTVSSTPGMCVLPSPSASLGSFFLRCLFSPSGFLLSLVYNVEVAHSSRC